MKRLYCLVLIGMFMAIPLFGTSAMSFASGTPVDLISGAAADNPAPMAPGYVGATSTGKFHYVTCTWAGKIRSDHRIYFNTRDEAMDAGYVPCKVCHP